MDGRRRTRRRAVNGTADRVRPPQPADEGVTGSGDGGSGSAQARCGARGDPAARDRPVRVKHSFDRSKRLSEFRSESALIPFDIDAAVGDREGEPRVLEPRPGRPLAV